MFLGLTNDQWQAVGVIATIVIPIVTSIVAVIISVVTLRQNNKMIEAANRPNLSIYGNYANTGILCLYFVIRNFGSSSAKITDITYDFDLVNCYRVKNNKDFIKSLIGCTIAPNQSKICILDYDKVDKEINFEVTYKSSTKTYKDKFAVDFRAGNTMVVPKSASKDKELEAISYTLQEMLQKDL